jgi:hypothetical protein
LFAIFSTLFPLLQFLNDFPANEPIGNNHIAVHRTNDIGPSLFHPRAELRLVEFSDDLPLLYFGIEIGVELGNRARYLAADQHGDNGL